MSSEDIILVESDKMAEAATSLHFHNMGLMDDQVDPEAWTEYSQKVRNKILDCVEKWEA